MKQTQGGHGISLSGPQTSRTPAAPARAPPRPGERGVTVWDESPSMLSPGSTTQGTRGGGPAHRSGSRASSLPSTALNTFAPSLPTHPPRPGPRRAISGDLARSRAISGPRRAISGDLALSRAISGPRRAISGDLGASLARRHTCSKRKEVGGRRSRPIQSAVVAGFLAPGSSPDGCCAGQQTIGRRDDAPSGTLPPPPGYCRTSALSGGIFPSRFLGPRQRRRTSRPPTCAAITAVIVGAAPLGARACPACPPAKAGAKANSTAKAGARAKSTAWLVPRLKGSPLSLLAPPSLSLPPFLPLTPHLFSPLPLLLSPLSSSLLSSPLLFSSSPLSSSPLSPPLPQQLPRGRTGRSSLIAKLPQGK